LHVGLGWAAPAVVSVRIGQTSGIRYVANSESVLRSPRCAALGRTRWRGFVQRQWLGRILWIASWSIGQDPPATCHSWGDESYIRRIDKFLKELIWMAKTLRQGREQISLDW